ncbi:MAG TPA: 3-hydroxyisobutyrate dehydrogenase [Usitatibacter sp.]|nr:3-hydroxyisobutyrate dehydrogenase [Usitatibacter sp.]
MKIGFVGLGHMGDPMCRNLLRNGHEVKVYDQAPARVRALVGAGGRAGESAAECARGVDCFVTMLPSSPNVRAVYQGEGGILAQVAAGTLLVDCSTIDPITAREVAMDAKAKGCAMVDAPVSGGVAGAEAATLTFMVGGEARDFEAAKPLLQCMGRNIVHCGPSGNGQAAKICNNLMLAIEMIATAEGMTLAAKLGMDPKVFAAIVNTSSGRCWSSDTYNPYPGVLENAPASRGYSGGFGADLMLKDLGLAADAAKAARQPILLGALAQQIYQKHSSAGHGEKDFSSVILQYLEPK